MPLVINTTLLNGTSRSYRWSSADAVPYCFLQNLEGTASTTCDEDHLQHKGVEVAVTNENDASQQACRRQLGRRGSFSSSTTRGNKKEETELILSQLLTYISEECQHSYNDMDLRNVLSGGNVTSVLFVDAKNEETSPYLEININLLQENGVVASKETTRTPKRQRLCASLSATMMKGWKRRKVCSSSPARTAPTTASSSSRLTQQISRPWKDCPTYRRMN